MARRVGPALRRYFAYLAAVGAWIGALAPIQLPMIVAIAVLAVAFIVRRPVVVLVSIALASAVLAGNALAGLVPPPSGPWEGTVTLVSDPVERGAGTSVDVDSSIGRLEVDAWGAAGRVLLDRSAGQLIDVAGTIEPLTNPERSVSRHMRSRLRATTVRPTGATVWWMVGPNAVRRVVLSGADSLPPEQRPVHGGFVLGDDRGRSDEITRWFESAGLTHLLVVSGENVVFLLIVVGPVLGRLGRRARFIATAMVLFGFAAITRFEPSVLRATVMAAIAAAAVLSGRRSNGRRTLAISVMLLVLIDPLLVHSIGFRLSVAASGGIVLLAPTIERRLPGPSRLRAVLAVTVAAQLAVAPVIVPMFGPMPLVAIPANVLAEPVAGLVMMWGSTAGILAGLIGGPVAAVLQLPTRIGLWWIIGVARVADSLPDVDLGLGAIVMLVIVIGLLTWAVGRLRRRDRRRLPVG